jgi:hypothetical protein
MFYTALPPWHAAQSSMALKSMPLLPSDPSLLPPSQLPILAPYRETIQADALSCWQPCSKTNGIEEGRRRISA